ncbi:MAG: hypothetical protein HKN78_07085 [Sphingomonadaceae bacterium]|nr:hypothetical protein [Sphingomonadaceae bacterium]
MNAPEALRAPPGFLRPIVLLVWGALFLFAAAALIGGVLQNFSTYRYVQAPFAEIGLSAQNDVDTEGERGVTVTSTPNVAAVAEIPDRTWLTSIDGVALTPDQDVREVAAMITGPIGETVEIGFDDGAGGAQVVALERSEASRLLVQPSFSGFLQQYVLPFIELLAGFGCLIVSALLMRRLNRDPVAILMAYGLTGLVLMGPGPYAFIGWFLTAPSTAADVGNILTYTLAFIPIAMALPAFPDGVYEPRWTGWFKWIAPLAGVLIIAGFATDTLPFLATSAVLAVLILLSAFAVLFRFRRMEPGTDKQKLKWVAAGFVFGLPAIIISETLVNSPLVSPFGFSAGASPAEVGILFLAAALRSVGALAIAIGMGMALLGIRLNDADGAFSRSAGYALITLVVGAIWAGMTTALTKGLGATFGPASAAGISSAVAAAVFVPTREKILNWTEQKFQPALVKMRKLPSKLSPFKHDHDPAELARGVLLAVANGVNASSAALVETTGEEPRVLGAYEMTEEEVLADFNSDTEGDSVFGLRVEFEDILGPVGSLLIGPRSDGASYNSDEREAVGLIVAPLSEALRATMRRARRNAEFATLLTQVDARIARLETMRDAV